MESIAQKKPVLGFQPWMQSTAVGVIIAAIFFAVLASGAKQYRSTVTILVIAKSPVAAMQQDAIVKNIAFLPTTLRFYDRLLQDNPTITDPTAGLSASERKSAWDRFVNVRQPARESASIIGLSTLARTQNDAEVLTLDAVRTLFAMVSGYYNVKEDIDVRIIDGPVTTVGIAGWQWLLLVSILLAAAVALALEKISFFATMSVPGKEEALQHIGGALHDLGKTFSMPGRTKSKSSLEDLYMSQDQPELFDVPDALDYGEQAAEKADEPIIDVPAWRYPNVPEMPVRNASPARNDVATSGEQSVAGGPVRYTARASAPDNLPMADDNFFVSQPPVEIQSAGNQNTMPETKQHEPTQEEIKQRLNQLLKGEL